MCQVIEHAIISKIATLQTPLELRTPDNALGVPFFITAVNSGSVTITLQDLNAGNDLEINNAAIVAAMLFLVRNGHCLGNPVNIESNNDPCLSGPLCRIARDQNNNVRCINYIVPILAHFGFADFDGNNPNSCWYI